MFELSSVPGDLLQPIAEVLEAALPTRVAYGPTMWADVPRGAAHLLGIDIAATIGERRLAELARQRRTPRS